MNKLFKNFFTLLATMLLLVIAVAAKAQEYDLAYLYEPKTRIATPVAMRDVGVVRSIVNTKFDLHVSAFAGVRDQRPLLGTWVGARFPVASNAAISFGPAITYEDSRFKSPGFVIGIKVSF